MLSTAAGIACAYANDISMGGTVSSKSATNGNDDSATNKQFSGDTMAEVEVSPGFLILAAADPESAPLQRLQVVKGWIDSDGLTHQDIIDVACAGGATVHTENNRCPNNGAKVDMSDCSINPQTGSAQLSTLWYDPKFNLQQRAFYYAWVIENPTCRWSTWDAISAGVAPRPDFTATLQERAWSSPIHYLAQ